MSNTNRTNPWVGIASYQEPTASNPTQYLFCGRDEASRDILTIIDNNLFSIIYGATGIGKTSILQAGVYPRLRKLNYIPISIRLGRADTNVKLADALIEAIKLEIEKQNCSIKQPDGLPEPKEEDRIWAFFKSSTFFNDREEPIYPVIVLDQLEEIFIHRNQDAAQLMQQIYMLIDDTRIIDNGSGYHDETNFRFVVSIREDYLYALEECIDTHYLTEMLYSRYRLGAMTDDEARSVILRPGEGLFAKQHEEDIVSHIIALAKNKQTKLINTLLLSLICARLYDIMSETGGSLISPLHLKNIGENPLQFFYQEASHKLSGKQRKFIEQSLVDREGHRTTISKDLFTQKAGWSDTLVEGPHRLLNIIPAASHADHSPRVELMHDMLASAIHTKRQKKRTQILDVFVLLPIYSGLTMLLLGSLILFSTLSSDNLFLILSGLPIIPLFYLACIGQQNKDSKNLFIVPLLVSYVFSMWLFAYAIPTKLLGGHPTIAYHELRPSSLESIFNAGAILTILLPMLTFAQFFYQRSEWNFRLSPGDYIGSRALKNQRNRIPFIALTIGLILPILLLIFPPRTHIEQLRDKAAANDPEALCELGDYYLQYCPDFTKAKSYYTQAKDLDYPVANERLETLSERYSEAMDTWLWYNSFTDQIRTDVLKYLLDKEAGKMSVISTAEINELYADNNQTPSFIKWNGNIKDECSIGAIRAYFERQNDHEAFMRWTCKMYPPHEIGYQFLLGEHIEQDKERALEIFYKYKAHQYIINMYVIDWKFKTALEYIDANQEEILNEKFAVNFPFINSLYWLLYY